MKKTLRLNRALSIRKNFLNINSYRLVIYRSNKNLYCQLLSICGKYILSSSSSIDRDLKNYILFNFGKNLNLSICRFLGKCIATKIISLNIYKIVFDRSGYKYHGCIKALADSARKYGLNF